MEYKFNPSNSDLSWKVWSFLNYWYGVICVKFQTILDIFDDILSNLEFDTRFSLDPVLVFPNKNFFSSFLFHNLNSSKNIRPFKHHFTLLSFSHSTMIHCLCVCLLVFWGQILCHLFCFSMNSSTIYSNYIHLKSWIA